MTRWSPYNYSFNNPVRFIDPDGMGPDDVIIRGPEAEKAFEQLKASVKGKMELSRDGKTGKVEIKSRNAELDKNAQKLANAIDDHSVKVMLTANTNGKIGEFGQVVGGVFIGAKNMKTKDGKAITVARQQLNTNYSTRIDNYYEVPGMTVLHEVTESYAGGKLVQKRGVDSGPSNTRDSVYPDAHRMATDPPPLIVTPYDEYGNRVGPDTGDYIYRVEYSMKIPGKSKEVLKGYQYNLEWYD